MIQIDLLLNLTEALAPFLRISLRLFVLSTAINLPLTGAIRIQLHPPTVITSLMLIIK